MQALQDPALFPTPFPAAWACDWGEDERGLWMALRVGGERQAFRWIAPGFFLMGSPEDEPERGLDETQHDVTLTRGYWLADTACTQGLWQAVMGSKPSRFIGDPALPVETVSWDDVQKFLERLNAAVPGLEARLPTEAQWEYACRAGTSTPFSFGAQVTPDQVNYNGRDPYADGREGVNRERTVPVKSLPPNAWGMYEMHGNVWEWCADWYGAYDPAAAVDPVGPPDGGFRVLRGGSWFGLGRRARSAFRLRLVPAERFDDFGFRLAPGHGEVLGGPAEPAQRAL